MSLIACAMSATLVLATDPVFNGDPCLYDVMCLSSCCNNDEDWSVEGKCVDIDDDDRCSRRREVSRIILVSYLSLFVLLIFVCGLMKKKQISD